MRSTSGQVWLASTNFGASCARSWPEVGQIWLVFGRNCPNHMLAKIGSFGRLLSSLGGRQNRHGKVSGARGEQRFGNFREALLSSRIGLAKASAITTTTVVRSPRSARRPPRALQVAPSPPASTPRRCARLDNNYAVVRAHTAEILGNVALRAKGKLRKLASQCTEILSAKALEDRSRQVREAAAQALGRAS